MLANTKWKLALAALGAVFGYGLGGARAATAEEGTWKWCTQVNAKEQCVTCWQKIGCEPEHHDYCCNPQADE